MRELTMEEFQLVAGGTRRCAADAGGSGNRYGGVSEPGSLGQDLIDIYEGLVAATSYVFERVANAF